MADDSTAVSDELPSAPSTDPASVAGAYGVFLALAALAYGALLVFVFAYGFHGEALTAGVDVACAEAAFQSGKKLEAKGNYDVAIQRYHQALEGRFADKEREFQCGRSIGDILLRLGRYEEAADAYRQLPPEAFTAPGSWTGYVTTLWRAGDYAEAERLGKTWLAAADAARDEKQRVWANTTLGRIAEATGRLDDALAFYLAAAAIEPKDGAAVLAAKIMRRQGRSADAARQLDDFLSRVPAGQLHEDARKLRAQLGAATPSQ